MRVLYCIICALDQVMYTYIPIPNANMSWCVVITCGETYGEEYKSGFLTWVVCMLLPCPMSLLRPKSISLAFQLSSKTMFADFISKCNILPLQWKNKWGEIFMYFQKLLCTPLFNLSCCLLLLILLLLWLQWHLKRYCCQRKKKKLLSKLSPIFSVFLHIIPVSTQVLMAENEDNVSNYAENWWVS